MLSPDVPLIVVEGNTVKVFEPVTSDQPLPKVYVPELATLLIEIEEIVPLGRPELPTENCTAAKICLKSTGV